LTTPSSGALVNVGTTIGVVGGSWRATVTPWGAVVPADGSPTLDWWVAADDRWHVPSEEPSIRQRLLHGAPVVETALRVPGGDALQHVYAVADAGGLTVVEIENASPRPLAVVVSRADLRTARPLVVTPIEGIDVPPDAVSFPLAHGSATRFALAHHRPGAGRLPPRLPGPDEVARGWVAQTTHDVDIQLPGGGPRPSLTTLRSALLLDGPGDPRLDGPAFLVGVAELARLHQSAVGRAVEVARAAERIARAHRSAQALPWDADAGLAAADEVLSGVDEVRGAADVRAVRARLLDPGPTPAEPPEGVLALAWAQRRVATAVRSGVDLFPDPFPLGWLGQSVAGYRIPLAGGRVSVAVRWHGERPALLWETDVDGPLTCSGLERSWGATARVGEALLSPVRPT
jgi:hypothetical protein